MTGEDLRQAGEALFGPFFQAQLADALAVSQRNVERWLSGEREIPAGVTADVIMLLRARSSECSQLIAALDA